MRCSCGHRACDGLSVFFLMSRMCEQIKCCKLLTLWVCFRVCFFWPNKLAIMTSIVDSEAHFERRIVEVGMSPGGKNALLAGGITSMGKLAFSHGQPGVPLNEDAFGNFARNVLGGLMNLGDQASLKRLLFESHTMILAQLKESITNPEASQTRKLPQVEREARMLRLKNNLSGVLIEGQMEPAHALLDATSQQWESRQLMYLDPSKCPSRDFEISMGKSAKQIHLDVDKLIIKEKSDVPSQSGMSELQTFEALRRRGLSYAFSDIISWACHERYLNKLFSHVRREPPANFQKPTLQQLLKADRAVFTKLIQESVSVRRDPVTNKLPIDERLEAALADYDVAFHLIPLPKSSTTKPAPVAPHTQARPSPYVSKGKGKSKSKSKGKSMLPKVFWNKDCVSTDPHGRRLCFDYSLGKCQAAADGAECEKGHHLCMRRSCQAPHPEKDHDKFVGPQ